MTTGHMATKKKPSSGGARKTGKLKELELRNRAPPLRGEEAEPKMIARLASAEQQHALHIEARTFIAKQATAKAERAQATRDAKIRQTKEKTEASTAAAAERREGEIARVRGKGQAEVSKVMSVVRQRSDEELATSAQKARQQGEQMAAAAERHAFEVARVQNKARDEVQKVDRATAHAKADAKAKAEALAATNAALLEAAEERRAARLGAIAAKGAAESAKVEAMGVRPQFQQRLAPDKQPPPLSPDSVVPTTPGTDTGANAHYRRPPPSPLPPPPIPRAGDGAQGVARGADLMLTLMRGGAPNNEVLLATTVADFEAIAQKYNIPLHG